MGNPHTEAQKRYNKAYTYTIQLRLNKKTDGDILTWLYAMGIGDQPTSKQRAIKDAIRRYMAYHYPNGEQIGIYTLDNPPD